MYTVYGDIYSGNCYKVKLIMSLLDIDHTWQHIDIMKQETRTPEFLAMNPNGRIPTVRVDEGPYAGQYLTESNAILNFFAEGTPYLPADRLVRTRVLQWQFFEQYSHEPFVAVARFVMKYLNQGKEQKESLDKKRVRGYAALDVMEQQLGQTPYLAGDDYTIADISLYAYTRVADEGGFSLDNYPNILAWFERIEAHSKHISMDEASSLI
ncbi:MAG: glutathione S-transferase family protein [Chloroflexota bacterium]